ncbi:MAG: hypothetical protein HFH27_04675 [Clostridiaceae bacterium]|nr:hypothetical protein [Clostridiaceae bacterium]
MKTGPRFGIPNTALFSRKNCPQLRYLAVLLVVFLVLLLVVLLVLLVLLVVLLAHVCSPLKMKYFHAHRQAA